MNIFSVDFSHAELNFLRQALETIPIQGRDAKFCASIQIKLEQELEEITKMLKAEEEAKILADSREQAEKDEMKNYLLQIKEMEKINFEDLIKILFNLFRIYIPKFKPDFEQKTISEEKSTL